MTGFARKTIVSQFERPRGLPGRLAGWIMATRPSSRQRSEWTVGLVGPRDGETLLEIGCGPGYALGYCAKQAARLSLTGIDHSRLMISEAMKRLEAQAAGGEWRLFQAGPEKLAEWPEQFDAIWSVNVIQFLGDPANVFATIKPALKPGGRVVTTYQPRHKSPTRQDTLDMAARIERAMKASGFVDIRTEILELEPVAAAAVIGFKPA